MVGEAGQRTWSRVAPWRVFASRFSEFLISRGIDHPALTADPAGLRPLVLDFRAFLRRWRRRATGQKEIGGPLDDRAVARPPRGVRHLFPAPHDHKTPAAAPPPQAPLPELTRNPPPLYHHAEHLTRPG